MQQQIRRGVWKEGAAYPLVRGHVVEDFGLKLKNVLAHSIKLAYVPGLLEFTEHFLERTSNILHDDDDWRGKRVCSRRKEKQETKEREKKKALFACLHPPRGVQIAEGCCRSPRHGDL